MHGLSCNISLKFHLHRMWNKLSGERNSGSVSSSIFTYSQGNVMLGCCGWLTGCCYAVSKVLWASKSIKMLRLRLRFSMLLCESYGVVSGWQCCYALAKVVSMGCYVNLIYKSLLCSCDCEWLWVVFSMLLCTCGWHAIAMPFTVCCEWPNQLKCWG